MSDALIPDLEFRAPDCPLCSKETNPVDGDFYCEECGLCWSQDGTGGCRTVDNEAQCTSERLPYADDGESDTNPLTAKYRSMFDKYRDHRYRCLLTDGHESSHRGARCNPPDPYDIREWTTAEAIKVEATS